MHVQAHDLGRKKWKTVSSQKDKTLMKHKFQGKMHQINMLQKTCMERKIKIYNDSKRVFKKQAWNCGLGWKDTEK